MKKSCLSLLLLIIIFSSCSTEKPKADKGNLDVGALVSAEESTYLPFKIQDQDVVRVREYFSKSNFTFKTFKISLGDKVTVPPKVNYKPASAEKNEKAINDFIGFLKDPGRVGFQGDSVFICGPHLTTLLRKSLVINELDFTKIVGVLMMGKKQHVIVSTVYRGASIQQVLKIVRNSILADDSFTVRKLGEREIDWYWQIINYDINEPILVFENRLHKVMIHFTAEGKIFFVDLFENLTW